MLISCIKMGCRDSVIKLHQYRLANGGTAKPCRPSSQLVGKVLHCRAQSGVNFCLAFCLTWPCGPSVPEQNAKYYVSIRVLPLDEDSACGSSCREANAWGPSVCLDLLSNGADEKFRFRRTVKLHVRALPSV